MVQIKLHPPLEPKNGNSLKVLSIDRISTLNQDPKSNDDQNAFTTAWLRERYDGPVDWTRITGQGSGESIDRKQVLRAHELVDSGEIDLVLMEDDLSRHVRRIHAMLFCELCEDTQTRLIAVNDHIDTATDWRLHAFFASIKNEQYNRETSLRIKRTLRNRFLNGEVLQCIRHCQA